MTDPGSIGSLAAAALAIGAETVVKTAVGEVVKDAYKGLKDAVSRWAGREIVTLEAAPDSAKMKQAVAEIIDQQTVDEQTKIKLLALALYEALRTAAAQKPIGYDIKLLEAASVSLKAANITEGKGFQIDTVKADEFTAEVTGVGKPVR